MPQPAIRPKPWRWWWEHAENKGLWVGGTLFVLATGLVVGYMLRRRSDPMEVARQFFQQAGSTKIDALSDTALLLQAHGNQPSGLVTLWPEESQQFTDGCITTLRTNLPITQGKAKIYVVYKGQGPANSDLQTLRSELQSEIIPLSSRLLEQALAADNCQRVLKDLEEPYLTRTDPYAESKPVLDPQWFYGRGELLKRLPGVLAQGQHVGIFGLCKVGKTSLINQLRQRFVTTPTVFIDCQAWPARAESYFAEILQQLHKGLAGQGEKDLTAPPATVNDEQFRQQFLVYWDGWQKAGRRGPFLLIFDEIDKFFPHREAKDSKEILTEYVRCFRLLRGLAQTRQCLVLLVIAYRPDVNRHNLLTQRIGENPMFRSFHEEYLGFLAAEESTTMIREIGTWKDIVWEPDAARRVFDYCGGHPLITRWFASEACEEGNRKNIDLARVEEVATDQQTTFRRNDIGNYYQEGVWDLLHGDEQQIFNRICQNGCDPIPESTLLAAGRDEEALTHLEQFGLVVSKQGEVHLTSALFRAWVQRKLGYK